MLEAKSFIATNAAEAPMATAVKMLENLAKSTAQAQQAIANLAGRMRQRKRYALSVRKRRHGSIAQIEELMDRDFDETP